MGGDFGPEVTVPAALRALELNPDLQLYLVGDQHQVDAELVSANADSRQRLSLPTYRYSRFE